jgi:hypothetical protein
LKGRNSSGRFGGTAVQLHNLERKVKIRRVNVLSPKIQLIGTEENIGIICVIKPIIPPQQYANIIMKSGPLGRSRY